MNRIPILSLPRNSASLATDPRSIAIAQSNARIRWEAGLAEEDDDEIPNQGASERMAAAVREDV